MFYHLQRKKLTAIMLPMEIGDFFIPAWLVFTSFIWIVFWKGMALWKAAHNEHRWWFAALLVVNTLGLLEIIYIIWDIRTRKKLAQTSDN